MAWAFMRLRKTACDICNKAAAVYAWLGGAMAINYMEKAK
jgi:hypothetical protein